MRRVAMLRALAVGALFAAACSGTETGNPPIDVPVGFHHLVPMGLSPDPRVDVAWLAVDELRLLERAGDGSCEGAASDAERNTLRELAVDLLGTRTSGAELPLERTSYCAARLDFGVPTIPAEAPPALAGRAAVIEGMLRSGERVEVWIDAAPTVLMEREDGSLYAVDESTPPWVLTMDTEALLAGPDYPSLERTSDNKVRIDAAHNTAAYRIILDNLSGTLHLREDLDGNGVIEGDEVRREVVF